jgi:murein DD-endopeptidase MepM/ murein hydrolase activator NlpD
MFVGMSLFLMSQGAAEGAELIGPTDPVAQGEVLQLLLKGVKDGDKVKGLWREQPLEFFKLGEEEYGSLLGIDLRLSPGTYPLEVQVDSPVNSLQTSRINIKVVKKDYGVQRLTLPENMVTLDPATLKRVRKEAAKFSELWYKHTPKRYWHSSFVRPVPGKLSTPFGLGRILNGEPRSPHSGVDLRAKLSEPVRAANHGRIVLVGDFFFHGKAVVIDHGWGLYSMYFHLSKANVAEGDLVGKNYVIGLAGSTGRATGPHLHWGVRLGGARVDPFALMRATGE